MGSMRLWTGLGKLVTLSLPLFLSGCSAVHPSGSATRQAAIVKEMIIKVNDHWQQSHSAKVRSFWDHGAYQTGNMAAYKLTGLSRYKDYAVTWAEHNHWQGATAKDRSSWKYNYGETAEHVLFGDWQVCFQTYIDLYLMDSVKQPSKIARAREVMEYQMSTPNNDYWWWADGLYMVMPVMTRLYQVTGNDLYLEKLYEYFRYADSLMYDKASGLYYRDGRYVYPKHKTPSGGKDFWSRGDGWVFAALAKVLTSLPVDAPHRNFYLDRFKGMAEALVSVQQEEGYWSRSLLDAQLAPGPETSGTAFFVYGLQMGIGNGLIKGAKSQKAADKGWKYLSQVALQADGAIGYVQPIGDRAIAGQKVGVESTADFGVGAFLLAATQRYKWLNGQL